MIDIYIHIYSLMRLKVSVGMMTLFWGGSHCTVPKEVYSIACGLNVFDIVNDYFPGCSWPFRHCGQVYFAQCSWPQPAFIFLLTINPYQYCFFNYILYEVTPLCALHTQYLTEVG